MLGDRRRVSSPAEPWPTEGPAVHSPPEGLPRGIVVAGMGRSGTSLVTGALGTYGWRLAEDLVRANRRNRKGHFEDTAINGLHKRLLAARGLDWNDVSALERLRGQRIDFPAELVPAVDALIADYRAGAPWVWKNPRATIFLDAWADALPEASFLLCVRDPAAVVSSLKRRRNSLREDRPLNRFEYVHRALNLWRSYNLRVLDFVTAHPDRAAVLLVPEDVPLLDRIAEGVYGGDLMHRPSRRMRWSTRLSRETMALYGRLRDLHDADRVERIVTALDARPAADRPQVDEAGHAAGG
jgi:Sulfotransferase family